MQDAISRPFFSRRPARPTIFVECTHTHGSPLNTGVQRVVRNVLRHAPAVAADYGYDVVPVIFERGHMVFADAREVLADKLAREPRETAAAPPEPVRRGLKSRMLQGLRPAWRLGLKVLAVLLPFDAARRFIYAPHNSASLAGMLRAPAQLLRSRRPEPVDPDAPPRTLDDYDDVTGSILLLLDSSWVAPVWGSVGRFKRGGGQVAGVIYDLIPITHGYSCVPELIAAFTYWLTEHAKHTDVFIGISKAIAADTARWMRAPGRGGKPRSLAPIDWFHLGSDLDFVAGAAPVRPSVEAIFAPERHVFLMVGSIEPRKNHALVVEAFERHWAAGGQSALVIVGRYGWKTEALIEHIASHPLLGERLFILRDATDAELDHGYRNASSLVIASQVEGFGLPVVEAFQRGLRVMCSDIPVFRELAEGRAEFFDLDGSDDLARALARFEAEVPIGARRDRSPQGWIGWRESTQQLFAAMMRALAAPSA